MKTVAKALILVMVSALALAILLPPTSSADEDNWKGIDTEDGLYDSINEGAKKIRVISDITISGDLSIPAGVKVLIPYGPSDNTGEKEGGKTYNIAGESYVYRRVTLNGNLSVSGELIIGGIIGYTDTFSYQGHTSADHSVLINNGTVNVKTGGSLCCFGFIKGSGEVVAESGSSVIEPLVITDFSGGDNLMSNYNANQAIFNRYSLSNIRCPLRIDYGAALYGKVTLYVAKDFWNTQVTYIGTEDPFIKLSKGASARLMYDPTKSIESDESLGLHSDIGKTTVTIIGGASFEAMDIFINGYGRSGTYSFAEHPFPLPYNIDMVLDSGDYLMNENFRILPGAKLTVGSDATLAVNNSFSVFWGLEDKNYKNNKPVNMKYPSTETLASNGFDKSGRLIVSGNLILLDNSEFNGIAEMDGDSASITVCKRTDTSLKTVKQGCKRSDSPPGISLFRWSVDSLTTREMAGYIVDSSGSLTILRPDSVYRAGPQNEYLMETYVQDGTSYTLGSVFKGGWIHSISTLQTLSSSVSDNLTGDKVNSMLSDAGVSQDFVIDLAVDSLRKVTVEPGAVTAIRDGNGALSIHCDGISVTFSTESLKNMSGTLEIGLNDTPLNDAQKASAQNRATYNLEVYSDGSRMEILHGVVTIVLPFEPHSEAEKEKVQAWKIDADGIAHTYKAAYSNNSISFAATSTGCYAISLDNVPSRSDIHDGNSGTMLIIAIGVAVAVAAGLLIYFFAIRKKA